MRYWNIQNELHRFLHRYQDLHMQRHLEKKEKNSINNPNLEPALIYGPEIHQAVFEYNPRVEESNKDVWKEQCLQFTRDTQKESICFYMSDTDVILTQSPEF